MNLVRSIARRAPRGVPFAAVLLLAACSDRIPTQAAAPAPGDLSRTRIDCVARVQSREVRCGGPAGGGPAGNLILGGQNTKVRLASSGTAFDSATSTLESSVTVQNLLGQDMGTPDGTTVTGVNVFFAAGPTVQAGAGGVEVLADSLGTFTATNQPYYHYPEILAPRGTSQPRPWRFVVSPTVVSFTFSVFVETRLAAESGVLRWTRVNGSAGWIALHDVWGSSPRNVFAVGGTGTVLHFDGQSWAAMPRATTQHLGTVTGSGPYDVWAAGISTIVHYDGNRWRVVQDSAPGMTVDEMAAPRAGHAWAVGWRRNPVTGRDDGMIRRTTSTGAQWTETAPADTVSKYLSGVFAVSDSHLYVAGYRWNTALGRYEALALRTTDAGATWAETVLPHGAERGLFSVWADSAGHAYMAGEQVDPVTGVQAGVVLRSADGGASWSAVTLPYVRDRQLWSVWGAADSAVYAGGQQRDTNGDWNGVLFRSSDHGATWAEVPGSWELAATGLWGSGPADVYVAGSGSLQHFDGTAWSLAQGESALDGYFEDAWSPDGKVVVAVGGGTLARSVDGGATWSTPPFTDPEVAGLRAVWGMSPSELWAVGSQGTNSRQPVLHSLDGGVSWSRVYPAPVQARMLNGVWGSSAGTVFMVGMQADPATGISVGVILRSSSGGVGWANAVTAPSPNGRYLYDIWGSTDTDLWVAGAEWHNASAELSGLMLHSTDGGVTWSEHPIARATAEELVGVWAGPGAGVYAVGNRTNPANGRKMAVLLHSVDAGATWVAERTATAPRNDFRFTGVWGSGPANVYVAGSFGTVLRWNGSSWLDLASGSRDELLGIFGSSPGDVWATGLHSTILHGVR